MLVCDANTLAKAETVLIGCHPQHLYIKLQNKTMDAAPSQGRRAIAYRLCLNSHRRRHFDVGFHLRTKQDLNGVDSQLADNGIKGALLWLDVTTDSFLDEVKLEFGQCMKALDKVYIVITDMSSNHAQVDHFMDACEDEFKQELQALLECSEEDDCGIEASDLQTNLRLCGITSAHGQLTTCSPVQIKSVLEDNTNNAPSCNIRGLLLENDSTVIVQIQTTDVQFLHTLRDWVLTGEADEHLTTNLRGGDIKCDRTSFAENYEKLSLMLNKPTLAQKQVLRAIDEHLKVHLKALAGADKTFVIMSVLEGAFHKVLNAKVLLVSKTKALVLFIASWLWRRTKPRHRVDRLARLHVMYNPLSAERCSVQLNESTGMLETRALAELACDKYTFLILDEAHHCCNTAE